jgi:hypothetical protein
MALGNLLYEENGKQLNARTADLLEPTAEISGMGSMKYGDVGINTHWTVSVKLGKNGVSYAQGRGIISAENNEVGTYSINGIAKPNSSGSGSSSRGYQFSTLHLMEENCLRSIIWLPYMNWNKIMTEIIRQRCGNGNKPP